MRVRTYDKIEYIVADPMHNYTILVLSEVDIEKQPEVASTLMKLEKYVEQVGFISYTDSGDITLRMAGGEFCGNATMATASYYASKNNLEVANVKVYVLGVEKIIDVKVRLTDGVWYGEVNMPKALAIKYIDIEENKNVPLIEFDGISHIIIEKGAVNKSLYDFDETNKKINENAKSRVESLIKNLCIKHNYKCLGMMFYDADTSCLNPLVYVKDADTLYWENSCASGTAAVGTYLAHKYKKDIEKIFIEPGGKLKTIANIDGKVVLCGSLVFCVD